MTFIDRRHRTAQCRALDLAMNACLGTADASQLEAARRAVDDALAHDHPLRIEVAEFAGHFPSIRRDPELLMDAGHRLWRAVQRSTWPDRASRADVGG